MGLFSTPKVPDTVSDEQMRELSERAREANPHLTSLSDPRAIQHRKAGSLQLSKADSN